MPYYVDTPPRTISGQYVDATFPLPVSSQRVVPASLSGYSETATWRVPPFFSGRGLGDANEVLTQAGQFVEQYGLWIAGGLAAFLLLGGGKKRR